MKDLKVNTLYYKDDPFFAFGSGILGYMGLIEGVIGMLAIMSIMGILQMLVYGNFFIGNFSKNGPMCVHQSVQTLNDVQLKCHGEDTFRDLISFGYVDEYYHLVKNDAAN